MHQPRRTRIGMTNSATVQEGKYHERVPTPRNRGEPSTEQQGASKGRTLDTTAHGDGHTQIQLSLSGDCEVVTGCSQPK